MNSTATNVPSTGARLVSLTDGRECELSGRSLVLGRDQGCDFVIAGRLVSRRHAEIIPTARGYLLVDTSSNGTLVNGRPVTEQHLLKRGDVIACGSHEIRFFTAGESGVAGAEPEPPSPAAGAHQRLSNTMHGIPAVSPSPPSPPSPAAPAAPTSSPTSPLPGAPPGAAQRLNNTMHGIPVHPRAPHGARQQLSNTMHGIPAAPPLLASFIGRSGSFKGRRFPVYVPVANIGRAEYNDIVLDDTSVSTAHAKLQRREGIWVIVDLESTNGTIIDGHRVTGEAPLSPGAVLQLGDIELLFQPTDDGIASQPGGGTRVVEGLDVGAPPPGRGTGPGQ